MPITAIKLRSIRIISLPVISSSSSSSNTRPVMRAVVRIGRTVRPSPKRGRASWRASSARCRVSNRPRWPVVVSISINMNWSSPCRRPIHFKPVKFLQYYIFSYFIINPLVAKY
uniref:Uncharacterized protein n=1 Tax=Anopheles aquasalis TaxID=42839 RepID=T1E8X8_ANOAQ